MTDHIVKSTPVLHLKPRFNLLSSILQRPLTLSRPRSDSIHLSPGEALGLGSRIVSNTISLSDLLITEVLGSLAVGPLVHCANNSSTKTKIVLQSSGSVLDRAVIGPATHVPDELSTLGKTGGTKRVTLADKTS